MQCYNSAGEWVGLSELVIDIDTENEYRSYVEASEIYVTL
jgi:hypothetical protein